VILLDTDTLTLVTMGHPKVPRRLDLAEDDIAITIVTRIEVLRGRFDFVLKAADGSQLLIAQQRLGDAEARLAEVPVVLFDSDAADEFDRLLQNKSVRKIGRADLLIASIALAQRATLVTRNVRHFHTIPGLRVVNWAD
jgi:tRNA(fMet)-specific endonuclease VapC